MMRHRLLLVLTSVAAACSSTGEPPVHQSQGSSAPLAINADAAPVVPAARYAAALRAGDWAKWPGLPADLREADLVRDLGLAGAAPHRRDGLLSRHDAVIVEIAGLRYWLRDRDHVVMLEVTGQLGTQAPAALQAQLGHPDREGPGRFLQSGATTTEYVYAGRGLAFTVAESYDQPPSFAPRLAAIQLFAATDLRTFVLELGGNDTTGPAR